LVLWLRAWGCVLPQPQFIAVWLKKLMSD
jgi:hypothetical protein